MNNKHFIIFLIITFTIVILNCNYIPPPCDYELISGTITIDTPGESAFSLPYDDITAEITVVGGGGGGGGPFENFLYGTGGGGGGAGEYKTVITKIIKDKNYIVYVGRGGTGGLISKDGNNGQQSYIKREDTPVDDYILNSDYGKKGKDGVNVLTATEDDKKNGGEGYESGDDGGGSIALSHRGEGGSNKFQYGNGGDGGYWAKENDGNHVARLGENGQHGCVIIKWAGIKYK